MRAHTNILVANVTRKAHQVLPQWRTYLSSTNRSRLLRSWVGALWIEVFGVWGPFWWWWSELEFRDGAVQSLRTLMCAQTSWTTLKSDSSSITWFSRKHCKIDQLLCFFLHLCHDLGLSIYIIGVKRSHSSIHYYHDRFKNDNTAIDILIFWHIGVQKKWYNLSKLGGGIEVIWTKSKQLLFSGNRLGKKSTIFFLIFSLLL